MGYSYIWKTQSKAINMFISCLLSLLFLSFGSAVELPIFSVSRTPKTIAVSPPFLPLTLGELIADTLAPIAILEPKSKKVFEKYGIDFQGNCYDCDLVNLKISRQKLVFTNVCDATQSIALKVLFIKKVNNQIIIGTPNSQWVLFKIAKEGVFQLKTEGSRMTNEGFKISTFFTLKKKMHQFKVHDCGDFEG